jgi:predicted flap endonuclease-1-like 5' DNA nuclease
MPINREPESIDDHGTEESAVRRTPLDQEEAYELQDHEFTLVAEEPVESGWPFDEHTAPWSTLPPLPAWATKARALLEPPTLPRPLNDETPTLVEDDGTHFSATALRALREELAQSAREAHARQEHIEQLERTLANAVQARAEAELKRGMATAELLGRVQGQAARIRELEETVRELEVVRVEPVVAEAEPALEVVAPAQLAIVESDAGVRLADELPGVASDSDADLETTVEWITNAAPSVEVTIEIDPNDDSVELSSTAALSGETTLEIDPDTDLMEADAPGPDVPDATAEELPAAVSGPTRASTTKSRRIARDDLQLIAGIGKRLEQRLNENGIRTFARIGAFRPAEIARVAKQIGVSPERIAREGWVRQARALKKKGAKRAVKRGGRKRA